MPQKKTKSGVSSYWKLVNHEDGEIWVWCNSKFRISDKEINKVQDYLAKFVKLNDQITFIGFDKEDRTIKGSKFLKVYNES